MGKKPTLRDIARLADVSLGTVSQVLNNKPGVSPDLRQRVLAVASEIGYRARVTIETPMMTDLKTIGLVTKWRAGEPVVNPFYSHVIAGAERECSRNNIGLMYANVEVDKNSHAHSFPAILLDERLGGVIVVGAFLEATIIRINEHARRNIVLVDSYTPNGTKFDSVLIDNIGGSVAAVNYLIDCGHRHIGIVGSEPGAHPSIQERHYGYLSVLKEHDLPAYVEDSSLYRESVQDATLRLINRHPEVTAIFACNDAAAIGVMSTLQQEGLRVPDDISVIGFDDIAVAQDVSPPLTTMQVDKVLMGVMAVRHLMDRVVNPDRTSLKTLVSPQLVERQTVCPVDIKEAR